MTNAPTHTDAQAHTHAHAHTKASAQDFALPPTEKQIEIVMCEYDLPEGLNFSDGFVAVDTESLGLKPHRDRLCLCQVSDGSGKVWLVPFPEGDYSKAINLKKILNDDNLCKIMHFARADIATMELYLDVQINNVYCTKIASKLSRTYTEQHGLGTLCRELLDISLNKEQQASYWAAEELTKAQQLYAANDVLYLHALRSVLDARLQEQGRHHHLLPCLAYLPHRARLDNAGWDDTDIFAHH